MTDQYSKLTDSLPGNWPARLAGVVRLGLDLAHIPRIQESLDRFGEAFERKLFTEDERAYAHAAPAHLGERLAARFAAKEAAIKALGLSEAGVNWRELEVVRAADGHCTLRLHGKARELAMQAGIGDCLLSMSHDGEYAAAVVAALSDRRTSGD